MSRYLSEHTTDRAGTHAQFPSRRIDGQPVDQYAPTGVDRPVMEFGRLSEFIEFSVRHDLIYPVISGLFYGPRHPVIRRDRRGAAVWLERPVPGAAQTATAPLWWLSTGQQRG